MDIKDLNELKRDFEELQKNCSDGSCISDENGHEEYPDYLIAIYKEVMPPVKSGIYFSKWDLKAMAAELDEHFALDIRERMFNKFMQSVATPDEMKAVMEQFFKHIDMKCQLYKEYSDRFPASKDMFERKIKKAENTKKYLDKIFIEFFS